ncbi:sister chromatid cohesion protein PDS5 [Sorangium sp. So ce542]|uniref:sister chromatid cohesion protein PDS5 n=1 Tax=Sorangium sp. So ce542 TaxID=3133316 RepID=UPI003F62C644
MDSVSQRGAPAEPDLAARERQYRQLLVEQFERLTFKGISRSGKAISLPLEDIYVELKAVADVPDAADTYSADERRLLVEAEARGLPDGDLRRELDSLRVERWREESRRGQGRMARRSMDEALADPARPGLVILGDPGCGKTTLLHYLALRAAREGLPERAGAAPRQGAELRAARGQPRLPIFVPLAAYDDWLRRDHEPLSLSDFLPVYYDTWCSRGGLAPLFRQALDEGRALVLLDGLDEVLDITTRRHIANQARALIQGEAARGNRFVVTSRIVGYREAQLPGDLPHVTVLDFGEREIEAFARRWCEACEVWLADGQRTTVALKRAAQEEKELLAEVRANPSVLRLAANPLLLTMLALLRRQGGRLPDERVRLYERYIEMLLDSNWESARSDGARTREPPRFDRNLATTYLIELALWLQRHKPSGTARRQDLEGALVEIALRADGLDPLRASAKDRQQAHDKAALFLKDMRHFAGLLAERGQDAFGFLHLTFQEYFAGRALARMDPEERWAILKENLHRPRWREPILLCAGQLGIVEGRNRAVSELGRRILGAQSPHEEILHRDVLLAGAMAADGVGFDRALLDELASKLMELADGRVPAVRVEALGGLAKLARASHEGARSWLVERVRRKRRPKEMARALEGVLGAECLVELRRALGEWLDGSDYSACRCAVDALKSVAPNDKSTRDLFLEKLSTEDINVRWMLVSALGALASTDGEARDILVGELVGADGGARQSAIIALAELASSDRTVRELVLARLDDAHHEVREEAIGALGPLVTTDAEVRRCVIAKLDDTDKWVRKAAVRVLGGLGSSDQEVRRLLVARLDDPHHEVREETMSALGALVSIDSEARRLVLARLDDGNPWTREVAVHALGALVSSDEEVGRLIRGRFVDPHYKVRIAALGALSPVASMDAKARQLALRGLMPEEWPMRSEVMPEMIGALKDLAPLDGEVRRLIIDKLNDRSSSVREEAVHALATSVQIEASVRDAVLGKLDDLDKIVSVAAVQALGKLISSDAEVRRRVLSKLDDEESAVCLTTIRALESLVPTDVEVRRLILGKLDHPDSLVRHAAVRALGALTPRDPEIRRLLFRAAGDRRTLVREAAVDALERLVTTDLEVRALVLRKLDDPGELVRAAAVRALEALVTNDEEARQQIIIGLNSSSNVVRWANTRTLAILLSTDEQARRLIIARLDDPGELTRAAAVRALGALVPSDAEVQRLVLSRLDDAETTVRVAALQALSGALPHDSALHEQVLKRLDDASFNVRRTAADALAPLIARDPYTRRRLIEWLGLVHEFGDAGLEQTRRRLAEGYADIIAEESSVFAQLVSMLRSPAWPERKGAAWALIAMPGGPPPEVLPALRGLLKDTRAEESWPARLRSAAMLINDRDPSVSQAAMAATVGALEYGTKPWHNLSRNAGDVRAQAAKVLGTLQPIYWNDVVFERLTRVLRDDADDEARDAAYHAILRLAVSPEAEHDIEALLKPPLDPAKQPSKSTPPSTTMQPLPPSLLLHLSDLHFGTRESAAAWYSQLAEDLRGELSCSRLDAVVLSGDIANQSTPEEYDAARLFLEKLCGEFQLSPQQVIPVPGNHDLHWGLAKKAYKLFERDDYTGKLEDGHFIDIGSGAVRVRDADLYPRRFEHFARFYEDLRGEPYPLSPEQQGLLYRFPAQRLLVLGLNSAWDLDHHFRARAAIHPQALSRALDQLRSEPATRDWLKIAVWHHPVNSAFEDRIKDHGFLERLAGADFRLGLHGHIHKAQNGLYRYDVSAAGRRLELVCAGTFGAPTHEWVPGYPLQYQLLRFEGGTLTVETRRREEINGTWKPDARWTAGRGKDPVPRYQLAL